MNKELRFWSKVRKTENGCWEWSACTGPTGYGRFSIAHSKWIYAHRYSYELANGPIPKDLILDHLCRNRACVNPAHLEAVTPTENKLRGESLNAKNARKTMCKHGHPLDEENTYVYHRKNGKVLRMCKICRAHLTNQWNRYVKLQRPKSAPKMACKHGHPFTEENTYLYRDTKGQAKRMCKACKTLRAREAYRLRR